MKTLHPVQRVTDAHQYESVCRPQLIALYTCALYRTLKRA